MMYHTLFFATAVQLEIRRLGDYQREDFLKPRTNNAVHRSRVVVALAMYHAGMSVDTIADCLGWTGKRSRRTITEWLSCGVDEIHTRAFLLRLDTQACLFAAEMCSRAVTTKLENWIAACDSSWRLAASCAMYYGSIVLEKQLRSES